MMAVILLNMHLEEGTSKLTGVWVANSKRNLQKVGIALLVDVYLQGDVDVFSNFSMIKCKCSFRTIKSLLQTQDKLEMEINKLNCSDYYILEIFFTQVQHTADNRSSHSHFILHPNTLLCIKPHQVHLSSISCVIDYIVSHYLLFFLIRNYSEILLLVALFCSFV